MKPMELESVQPAQRKLSDNIFPRSDDHSEICPVFDSESISIREGESRSIC